MHAMAAPTAPTAPGLLQLGLVAALALASVGRPGAAAAVAATAPVTWVSAGDAAGQALLVGMPLVTGAAGSSRLSARLVLGSRRLEVSVLQQGNGSVMLGLPSDFALAPWGLRLCAATGGSSSCADEAPVLPIYAADVMWASCDGAACAAGETLRLFGRRLAFDARGCRPYNSSLPISGRELQLQLTPASSYSAAAAPVLLKATQQSCFDAAFALPVGLAPGLYTVSVANSVVAGHLSGFAPPHQPDLHTLRVFAVPHRGAAEFTPKAKTGAAIVAALAEAAKHSTGAVVQLAAGTVSKKDEFLIKNKELCTKKQGILYQKQGILH